MTLDIANNLLSYNGKTIGFDEAINQVSTLSASQIVSFFNNRSKKIPRKINMLALRAVLNDRVVHSKEIELTDEQRYRLFCYPAFCDTQLQNYMKIVGTPELFQVYLKMLWKLTLMNYEVIDLVDGELSYLLNLTSTGMPTEFEAFASETTAIFSDRPGDFDGLEKNDFRSVAAKSSTLVELREIGAKYNLNIPRRLKKEELQAIIVEELKDMGKYDDETAQTLDIMSVLTMQRFAKKNGIKISIELKKEELIEYVLKQADKADLPKSEKFINIISLPEIDDFEFRNDYIEDIPEEPVVVEIPEPEVIPAQRELPTIQFSEDDDFEDDDSDDDSEELIDEETGKVYIVHYKKSFNARYILSNSDLQDNYTILKNKLLSYENVKSRVSWNYDSFNINKQQIAKLNVRNRKLTLYLALNPADLADTAYSVTDVSDIKRFEKVPTMLSIFTDNDVRQALELIDKLNLEAAESFEKCDYHLPTADMPTLVEQGLVKKVVFDKETGLEIKPIDGPFVEIEKAAEPAPVEETPVVEETVKPAPVQEAAPRVETVYVQAATPVVAAPSIDAETLKSIIKETVTEIVNQTRPEPTPVVEEEAKPVEPSPAPQVIQQGLSVEDVKAIIREFAEANKAPTPAPLISTEDIRYLVEGTVRQVVSQIVDKIPQPQAFVQQSYAQPQVVMQSAELVNDKAEDDYTGFEFDAHSTDATNALFDGEIAEKMNNASDLALPKNPVIPLGQVTEEEEAPQLTPKEQKLQNKKEKKAKKKEKKAQKKQAKIDHKKELKLKQIARNEAYKKMVAERKAIKSKDLFSGKISDEQVKAINAKLAVAQMNEIENRQKRIRNRKIVKLVVYLVVIIILVFAIYFGMLVWYEYNDNAFARGVNEFSEKYFGDFHKTISEQANKCAEWIKSLIKK